MPVDDGLICVLQEVLYKVFTKVEKGPDGMVTKSVHGQEPISSTCELIKIDDTGKIAWRKTLGSVAGSHDYIVPDGNAGLFLITTKYNNKSPLGSNVAVVKRLSLDGKIIWKIDNFLQPINQGMTGLSLTSDGKGGVFAAWHLMKFEPGGENPKSNINTVLVRLGSPVAEKNPKMDIYILHIVDDGSGWPDVAADDWSFSYIDHLVKLGAIEGSKDGGFEPNEHISRADFVNAVAIAFETTETTSPATPAVKISDIDDSPHKKNIQAAISSGIVRGFSDGTFKPDAYITRSEAAAIVFRAAGLNQTIAYGAFGDVTESHWAAGIINTLYDLGIINGYTGSLFKPSGFVTRAEAAKMIYKAMSLREQKDE